MRYLRWISNLQSEVNNLLINKTSKSLHHLGYCWIGGGGGGAQLAQQGRFHCVRYTFYSYREIQKWQNCLTAGRALTLSPEHQIYHAPDIVSSPPCLNALHNNIEEKYEYRSYKIKKITCYNASVQDAYFVHVYSVQSSI